MPRVRTRSVEWLLALLVLRHGRAVDRAWLAGTLWPESEEQRARQNLRNDLVVLRKALGPEADRLQASSRDTLVLDLDGAEVDVVRFDAGILRDDEASLQKAVDAYGGPLLEGCYEAWVLAERESRAAQCLTALERLTGWAEARGDHEAAVHFLKRAETLDPLRDSTIRRLMTSLAATGAPAAAITTYRDFRNRLHEELSTSPEEATTRIYREIRAQAAQAASAGRGRVPVVSPSGPPPQRAAHSRPPHPLSPLIGREDVVAEVQLRLRNARLVTLVGTGGVGKTRLAMEIAGRMEEDWVGGAVWVELAALREESLLLPQIGTALCLQEEGGPGDATLEARIATRLSNGSVLLTLDNCEHLLDAAAGSVERLLQACPDLRVLATSRQRLGLPGEVVLHVPSLSSPDPIELPDTDEAAIRHALKSPAVRLFVERAEAVRPAFAVSDRAAVEAVCTICRRLDGIPLALELAAARVGTLSPGQIAARLDDRFALLTQGSRSALPRHRTLQALIDWSYGLLTDEERALLRRLSVFVGGWTLEAAEAVAGGPNARIGLSDTLDLLASLSDWSLVVVEEDADGLRYRMRETLREYGLTRLRETQEEEDVRNRHLDYYRDLAQQIGPALQEAMPESIRRRVDVELGNFRGALAWAQNPAVSPDAHLNLAAALWPYWAQSGAIMEGRAQLRAALSRSDGSPSAAYAEACLGAASLAFVQFDLEEVREKAQESVTVFRALGDRCRSASALYCLGSVIRQQGDLARAATLAAEGLEAAHQCNWARGIIQGLLLSGFIGTQRGDESARSRVEEGLKRAEALGDEQLMAQALNMLGYFALQANEHQRASAPLLRALTLQSKLGYKPNTALTLRRLGTVAYRQGEFADALSYFQEAVTLSREIGNQVHLAINLGELGLVCCQQGDLAGARESLCEALALHQKANDMPGILSTLIRFALVEAREGKREETALLVRSVCAQSEEARAKWARGVQESWQSAIEDIRSALGEDAYAAACGAGPTMTLDQAVEYALSTV